MLCVMIHGRGSGTCCRAASAMWAARRRTTGCLWKRCSTAIAPGCPGATCPSALETGKTCIGAGAAGHKARCGKRVFVLKYRTVQVEGQNEAQLNQSAGARFGAQLRDHALIAEDG